MEVIDASIADDAQPIDASVDDDETDAPEPLGPLFENGVTLLEAAGNIIHANMKDCDAMGDRLEEYLQTHVGAVARVKALYKPERTDERKAMQSQYRVRFRAAWANVRPGITKCKDAPQMRRVIHQIWGDDMDAGSTPPP